MRLRVRVHEVSRGTRLRRVVTPAAPLRDTHLTGHLQRHHCGALFGSRADLLRLGALFRLAATSPHSAVFVPLRSNVPSASAASWAQDRGLADLVVLRREVPLRPSAWPQIRARMRRGPHPGTPATVRTPPPRAPLPTERWDWLRHELSVVQHAETVFLQATPRGLHQAGDELTAAGDEVAVNAAIHRFGGPAIVGRFLGPSWHTGRRSDDWECDLLAEDRIFQQPGWTYETGADWVRRRRSGRKHAADDHA